MQPACEIPPREPHRAGLLAGLPAGYDAGMFVAQSIQRPQGINVFGSCLVRVEPDYASLRFSVNRVADKPAPSFAEARVASAKVRAYLEAMAVPAGDVRTSRIALEQAYDGYGNERKFIGYRSTVSFLVLLGDFDKLELVLQGIVESGADSIDRVSFKTRRLREARAQARAGAIAAARVKAEGYAQAAGVKLGTALHIEDVNPDDASRRSHLPDVDLDAHDESSAASDAAGPGSIVIAGAVMVCYAILG